MNQLIVSHCGTERDFNGKTMTLGLVSLINSCETPDVFMEFCALVSPFVK